MSLRIFSLALCLAMVTGLRAQNADINMLRSIHVPDPHRMDQPMRIVTNSVLPMVIAVPVTSLIYHLTQSGSFTENKEPFIIGLSVFAGSTITLGLKHIVNRPRPFVTYTDVTQKDDHIGPYSFPSGHTTSAFALATSVSLCYPKWYVIAPAYLYAFTVGFSRMWLGVHYPSDVLIGALIGTACSFGSYYLVKQLDR
jgi:membrane-associated phospholipid phosphatase